MKYSIILILSTLLIAGCASCKPDVEFSQCNTAQEELTRTDCYKWGVDHVKCRQSCDNVEEPLYQDLCYSRIAANEGDVNVCENIKNKSIAEDCIDAALQ